MQMAKTLRNIFFFLRLNRLNGSTQILQVLATDLSILKPFERFEKFEKAGVFAVFEWHDLNFQLSKPTASVLTRHAFYLFQDGILILHKYKLYDKGMKRDRFFY